MEQYGVLIGKVVNIDKDNVNNDEKPHYNLTIEGENRKKYKLPINVQSKDKHMSKVLYYSDANYQAHAITILPTMSSGFHKINHQQNVNADIAVDYIRSGLFNPNEMVPLPPNAPGDKNDLYEFIDEHMHNALNNDDAVIYAYGTFFPNGGNGVHNVHMNQGNFLFARDENGAYHDGCFLLHFKNENKWIAYFLAFQSQSWCTDENGEPTEGSLDKDGYPAGACKFNQVKVKLQNGEPTPVS